MRWPIRLQILLPFASTMLAAIAAVSALNAYWAARRTEQRIERQLQSVVRTLQDTTFPLSDAVLEQMHGLSGAEFILSRPDGRTLAASGPRNFATAAGAPPATNWRDVQLGPAVEVADEKYFWSSVELRRRTAAVERLTILYPQRVWREARREAMLPPAVVGLGALAAVVVLGIAVALRISRPIQAVVEGVGRLAAGDYRPLPTPERNDELRDLVGSVNRLAAELEQLRGAVARAERLSLLGQLSGGLAHHLRNAIAGAKMALQLHQRKCRAGDPESLDVALRQLALTEEQLKRFLTAGKPAALRRDAVDLASVVDELVALVGPSCAHRRIALEWDRAAAGPCRASIDADQIRQALLNLVFNAMEAAGPGGWVRIEIDSDPRVGATVRVVDSGPGAPEEIAGRMFEPFASAKSEGIGLGLAVARQVATAHGGDVVYRRNDAATFFDLRLPADCLLANDAPVGENRVSTA